MSKRKLTYKDFIQYFSNNLLNKDKHVFEKDMMRDTFEEEAFDGLSKLREEELEQDIVDIKSIIHKRIKKKRILIPLWYRYAASVVILIGIGLSIFFLNSRFWQDSMLKEQISEEMEIMDSMLFEADFEIEKVATLSKKDSSEEMPTDLIANNRSIETNEEIIIVEDDIEIEDELILDDSEIDNDEALRFDNELVIVEFEEDEEIVLEEPVLKVENNVTEEQVSYAETEIVANIVEEEKKNEVAGRNNTEVTSQKSAQPIFAKSVKRAKESTNKGAGSYDKLDDTEIINTEAKPSGQMAETSPQKYISKKIDYSKLSKFTGIHTIKFSFIVTKTGKLSNFNFTQSPNAIFNNEIMRVMKESGNWIPATDQNQNINSRVKLTLKIEVKNQ